MWAVAREKNQRLATLSIDAAIQFRSPADRAAVTQELSQAVASLPEAGEGHEMPLKKDDSGRRWVEMEFLVPGMPEQVWQAIVTLAAWPPRR